LDTKRKILLIVSILIVGCAKDSNIKVNVCNSSSFPKRHIMLKWNDGSYAFENITKGNCKEIQLSNIKSESDLILNIANKDYRIDTYFEPRNYHGTINIYLGDNESVKVKSSIKIN
jgi:hypothetical protein